MIDKETAKLLSDDEEISAMTKSLGWGLVREKIFMKIMELNDITTITEIDPQRLMIVIAAKQEAVKILFEWLNEIEGIAKTSKQLRDQFIQKQKEDFIMHFETSGQE